MQDLGRFHTRGRTNRLDGQIVWMDKSSGICPSDVNLWRTVVDLFNSQRINCLGKIVFPDRQISDDLFVRFSHRLEGHIIWHLSVWYELMSYCRRLVCLDGQIIREKSSFQTAKYQTICSSKNFFVPFSHQMILFAWDDLSVQTICSSSSVKTSDFSEQTICLSSSVKTAIDHLEENVQDLRYQFDCCYTCTSPVLYRINFSYDFFLSFLDTFHTLLK